MDQDACERGGGCDLHGPARRGLFWASVLCVAAVIAAGELGAHATDEVHRAMFRIFAGGLAIAAIILQGAALRLRWRRSRS